MNFSLYMNMAGFCSDSQYMHMHICMYLKRLTLMLVSSVSSSDSLLSALDCSPSAEYCNNICICYYFWYYFNLSELTSECSANHNYVATGVIHTIVHM